LNELSNVMLAEACHTPEKANEYESIFSLNGKMYNHGFFNNNLDFEKLDTNWDLLSENIEFSIKLESMLEDIVFSSDIDQPYKPFLLIDFKYKTERFLQEFFTRMGLYFKADGIDVYINPLFSEIQVMEISNSDSLMMDNEPFAYYYEDVEIMNQVDTLFKENLENIRRISFNKSYSFTGTFPTFLIGETKDGNNLVGLFSVGTYT